MVLKLRIRNRVLPLLICALALAACGFGVRGAYVERQRQQLILQQRTKCAQALADSLALLHNGREAYLSAAQRVRDGKNAYDTQKDIVRIAKEAIDTRRAALAKAEASGTLSGDALTEARSELELLLSDFAARENELAEYEELAAKTQAYEQEKTHARELLKELCEDARIRKKLESGMGPIAAAQAALVEEAAALRRRFYIMLSVFAVIGFSAVFVLWRALRALSQQ